MGAFDRPALRLSDLPRRDALLVLSLDEGLRRLLAQREPGGQQVADCPGVRLPGLLLAVSGGADSTALACLMALVRRRRNFGPTQAREPGSLRLRALACDHGLRKESAGDAAFAMDLCEWLGIPCRTVELPVAEESRRLGLGIEETARRLRYEALEAERRATECDFVVTAHHAGDLAEDILMRLVRGTGWPALGGMAPVDRDRRLLRPLLATDPGELRAFLDHAGVPHREDASNLDSAYTRNRMRHDILPLLEAENPNIRATLLRLARLARIDAAFFEETIDEALADTPWQADNEKEPTAIRLPAALLDALAPALQLRLVLRAARCVARNGGGQARSQALLDLLDARAAGGRRRVYQMCGGLEAVLEEGSVTIARRA